MEELFNTINNPNKVKVNLDEKEELFYNQNECVSNIKDEVGNILFKLYIR